jgi:hypothetical protein
LPYGTLFAAFAGMTIIQSFKAVPDKLSNLRKSFETLHPIITNRKLNFLLLVECPTVQKYLKLIIEKSIPNSKTIHFFDYDDAFENGTAPEIHYLVVYDIWLSSNGYATAKAVRNLNPGCTLLYVSDIPGFINTRIRLYLKEDYCLLLKGDPLEFATDLFQIVLESEAKRVSP